MKCILCERSTVAKDGYFVEEFSDGWLDKHIWLDSYEYLKGILSAAKYRGETFHYDHLIKWAYQALVCEEANSDFMITYIPTIKSHIKSRGYDHAKILSEKLGRISRVRVKQLLIPTHNESQVLLNKELRKCNPHYLSFNKLLAKKIVVVDDTSTTRASLNSAAFALKHAGASRVIGFTLGYKN